MSDSFSMFNCSVLLKCVCAYKFDQVKVTSTHTNQQYEDVSLRWALSYMFSWSTQIIPTCMEHDEFKLYMYTFCNREDIL